MLSECQLPSVTEYVFCRAIYNVNISRIATFQMYAISSRVNSDINNAKGSQELNNNICYLRTENFFAAMEKQRDEGGSRIPLDGNTGGAAVKLRPLRFRRVGASISNELNCIYIYS